MTVSTLNISCSRLLRLAAVLLLCPAVHAESIPLVRDHGTLQVPVVINGRTSLNFTIDSGATDVSVPADLYYSLIRAGTVTQQDFMDKRAYKLADGSTQYSPRFRIKSLQVGHLELHDVTASVVPSAGSLLLGQSFLSRLKSWSIDNERQELVILESAGGSAASMPPRVAKDSPKSGWVRLSAMSDPKGELYVNTASVQADGSLRRLADKHVFPAHTERWQGKWVSYAMDEWEFDCAEERAKLDARTDYYEDGTRWVANSALLSSTAWHGVRGDAWKQAEMKLLCQNSAR